jgi:hypothetical protein
MLNSLLNYSCLKIIFKLKTTNNRIEHVQFFALKKSGGKIILKQKIKAIQK